MSLSLDVRQRAMLAEMGLQVWLPEAVVPDGVAAAPAAAPETVALSARPVRAPAILEAPASLDGMQWEALGEAVGACRACKLCNGRRNAVAGSGAERADWLFVGDAPGESEDLSGQPFAGQEGKLLDNMLRALGLDRRGNVYLTNVLKCRPPGNRVAEAAEAAQCEPFLRRQVELLQPRVIVAMGRLAAQSLLQTQEPIGKLRGREHQYHGAPLVVTLHPAELLRKPADKAMAWADLCLARVVVEKAQGGQAGSGR